MNSNGQQKQQQQQQQQQQAQLQRRLQQVRAEEAALEQQLAVQEFAARYPFRLAWPALLRGHRRTRAELLQHRLLEAGILYEVPTDTAATVEAAGRFVADLEATDCFHAVAVQIGGAAQQAETAVSATRTQSQQQQQDNNNETNNTELPEERTIHVTVKEKNWYRLHAGAGLKTGSLLGGGSSSAGGSQQQQYGSSTTQLATDSFLPTAEFELSAGLRNVAGVLDRTDLQYRVDTHGTGTWTASHTRPLYTVLPGALSESVLAQGRGSQYHFAARAALDTVDRELVSRYREYQRRIAFQAATHPHGNTTATRENNSNDNTENPWYASLDWAVTYRDLIPRRHPTLPYHLAASPEIVAAAGASVKHAWTAHVKYDNTVTGSSAAGGDPEGSGNNHHHNDIDLSGLPTRGVQLDCTTELAAPPGDVGFVKAQAAVAAHAAIPGTAAALPQLALHATLSAGILRELSFRGLCGGPGPSDRFLLGGTGSFRGFVPAGMGPRSTVSGNRSSGNHHPGDALGGDFFYTATLAASTTPPTALTQSPLGALALVSRHVRLFGFATAGTCCATAAAAMTANASPVSAGDVLRSTRLSAGVGIATRALGPARLEVTYAWPLRYGPRDGRRRVQLGVSLSL